MQEDKSDIKDKQQQENSITNNKEQIIKQESFEVYKYQVSGKTPKYIDNVRGLIYKIYSQSEFQFYEHMKSIEQKDQRYRLKTHIPQYIGIYEEDELNGLLNLKKQGSVVTSKKQNVAESPNKANRDVWIQHIAARNIESPEKKINYLCLKNLTYKYEVPNILDIKLGRKKFKQSNVKFATSTTNSHHFRINGMVAHLDNGKEYEQCFVSKYFGQKITEQQIEQYLALFFFNGKHIDIQLLERIIQELKRMIASFKMFRGIKFTSSSLFIAYDQIDHSKYCLKLIDFDKYQHDQNVEEDINISKGLENVLLFLQNIGKVDSQHQQAILKKQLRIFNQEVMIVPQAKIAKYEKDKNDQKQ